METKRKGWATTKYPIVDMKRGDVISFEIESPHHERLLRKSADNWNARHPKGFIRARKRDGVITFYRLR